MKRRWLIASGIGFGLALAVLIFIWSGFHSPQVRASAVAWESHARDVLLETQQLLLALDDAETGQRGFVITGQADYLEPYETGRREAATSLDALAGLTGDNAGQQARIGDLRAIVAAKLTNLAEVVALVRSGNMAGAGAAVKTGRGKALMDEARDSLRVIGAEERQLLAARHAAAEKAAENDRRFLYEVTAFGLVALLAAAIATFLAFRSVGRERLSAALVASTEQVRLLVERAPAAIAMFDASMRYVVASQRYLREYNLHEAGGADALIGRSHYEVFPDVPQRWRDIHRRVLAGETLTAEDDQFTRADGSLDYVRWEMTPWHQEDETIGGAVLFSEVLTARKQAELHQKVLFELSAQLQDQSREPLAAASELVGIHLGISRVGFEEVGETGDLVCVGRQYTEGMVAAPAAVDTHSLGDLGPEIGEALRAGRTLAVSDVLSDPRIRGDVSTAALKDDTRSTAMVPIVRQGQLRATFCLRHRHPRVWTTEEVRLAEDVASHAWTSVERVRLQEEIEQTAEQFRMLADGLPALCWMARPDGHIYWYNQRWYDYTGTTLLEMAGSGWESVHDPDILPAVLKWWHASLAAGAPFEMTFPLRGAEGLFRPFMTRVVSVRDGDGEIRCWLGVNTDMTESAARDEALRLSTQALRESEARLQAIFDAAPVGITIGEAPAGELVAANQMAETIFGHPMLYSPGAEHYYRDWVAFHADGRRLVGDEYPMARALAGEDRPEIEVLYQRGDGTRAWVRLIGAPIRTEGKISGALVVSLDIDREVRAREMLAQTRGQLESRVTKEVQARQVAQAALAQGEKLSALGQLAGGVAHDFNNVMQAVSNGAALIGRHGSDPVRVKRYATMVEEAARRGSAVTRRLLAFARRDELRAEAVDLSALLEGIREVLKHTLSAGIRIELDVAQRLPLVLADQSQLETVLVNLATNARDAMPEGGTVTFSGITEDVTGRNHSESLVPGTYVRLMVADTGSGIDPDTLTRVMEPFFTTKAQGKGTGLGLSMARGFAQQSGGALAISSQLGQGTSVTIWLPVTSETVHSPADTGDFSPAVGADAAKVLLVDDEIMVREMLAVELSDRGYKVLQAEGGTAALALLDAGEQVDLLISDLAMPRMDGVALIREAQARRPRLPAILLTGYAGDAASVAVGGAVTGSFSLLLKPISGSRLADRVAMLLGYPQGITAT